MSRRIAQTPRAVEDVVGHALYLAEEGGIALADRFLNAYDRTLNLLVDLPDMGSPRHFRHPKLRGVRVVPVRAFDQHLIFYRPMPTGIMVVRMLHARRDLDAAL